MTPIKSLRRPFACLPSLAVFVTGSVLLSGCANTQTTSPLSPREVVPMADIKSSLTDTVDVASLQIEAAAETAAIAPSPTTTLPQPVIEKTRHHYFCAEYARLRSGFAIFGDAKSWWKRAQSAYYELARPVSNSVMVFESSRRIARGHVAVVARLMTSRIVTVDQANWQNHGEIDRDTPVLDVSAGNDWSEVRVWDTRAAGFGAHVYRLKGFIANLLPADGLTLAARAPAPR